MGAAALVIGIISIILGNIPYVGLLFATLPAVVGLILGIAGRRRMKTGQGIATSGIILNLLAMACIAGWTFWAFRKNGVPTEWRRKPDYTFACMNQQKQLLLALAMYCEDFDDMMPPQENWQELLDYYARNKGLFQCCGGEGEYRYFGNGHKFEIGKPNVTILFVCTADHGGEQNAAFADGHVESLPPEHVKAAIEHCEPGELPVLER